MVVLDHLIDEMEELGSFPSQGIEGARFNQAFKDFFVDKFGIVPAEDVERR